MRVISGFLKGKEIIGYDIIGTRPTMDRVKKSVFDSIQNDIKDSIVLDLFAGSGNLGIEAISNGASLCYFVDNGKSAIKVINDNINKMKVKDNSVIINMDYEKALEYFYHKKITFDIIFVDPPYDMVIIEKIINLISKYDLLNSGGKLVVEFRSDKLQDSYGNMIVVKKKKYGDKFVHIYKVE